MTVNSSDAMSSNKVISVKYRHMIREAVTMFSTINHVTWHVFSTFELSNDERAKVGLTLDLSTCENYKMHFLPTQNMSHDNSFQTVKSKWKEDVSSKRMLLLLTKQGCFY